MFKRDHSNTDAHFVLIEKNPHSGEIVEEPLVESASYPLHSSMKDSPLSSSPSSISSANSLGIKFRDKISKNLRPTSVLGALASSGSGHHYSSSFSNGSSSSLSVHTISSPTLNVPSPNLASASGFSPYNAPSSAGSSIHGGAIPVTPSSPNSTFSQLHALSPKTSSSSINSASPRYAGAARPTQSLKIPYASNLPNSQLANKELLELLAAVDPTNERLAGDSSLHNIPDQLDPRKTQLASSIMSVFPAPSSVTSPKRIAQPQPQSHVGTLQSNNPFLSALSQVSDPEATTLATAQTLPLKPTPSSSSSSSSANVYANGIPTVSIPIPIDSKLDSSASKNRNSQDSPLNSAFREHSKRPSTSSSASYRKPVSRNTNSLDPSSPISPISVTHKHTPGENDNEEGYPESDTDSFTIGDEQRMSVLAMDTSNLDELIAAAGRDHVAEQHNNHSRNYPSGLQSLETTPRVAGGARYATNGDGIRNVSANSMASDVSGWSDLSTLSNISGVGHDRQDDGQPNIYHPALPPPLPPRPETHLEGSHPHLRIDTFASSFKPTIQNVSASSANFQSYKASIHTPTSGESDVTSSTIQSKVPLSAASITSDSSLRIAKRQGLDTINSSEEKEINNLENLLAASRSSPVAQSDASQSLHTKQPPQTAVLQPMFEPKPTTSDVTSHELSIGDDAQSGDENVSTSATVPNSQDTSLNSPELPRSPVNESSIENLSTSDSQPLAMASKDRSSSTTSQPPPEVTQGLPIGDSAALPADKLESSSSLPSSLSTLSSMPDNTMSDIAIKTTSQQMFFKDSGFIDSQTQSHNAIAIAPQHPNNEEATQGSDKSPQSRPFQQRMRHSSSSSIYYSDGSIIPMAGVDLSGVPSQMFYDYETNSHHARLRTPSYPGSSTNLSRISLPFNGSSSPNLAALAHSTSNPQSLGLPDGLRRDSAIMGGYMNDAGYTTNSSGYSFSQSASSSKLNLANIPSSLQPSGPSMQATQGKYPYSTFGQQQSVHQSGHLPIIHRETPQILLGSTGIEVIHSDRRPDESLSQGIQFNASPSSLPMDSDEMLRRLQQEYEVQESKYKQQLVQLHGTEQQVQQQQQGQSLYQNEAADVSTSRFPATFEEYDQLKKDKEAAALAAALEEKRLNGSQNIFQRVLQKRKTSIVPSDASSSSLSATADPNSVQAEASSTQLTDQPPSINISASTAPVVPPISQLTAPIAISPNLAPNSAQSMTSSPISVGTPVRSPAFTHISNSPIGLSPVPIGTPARSPSFMPALNGSPGFAFASVPAPPQANYFANPYSVSDQNVPTMVYPESGEGTAQPLEPPTLDVNATSSTNIPSLQLSQSPVATIMSSPAPSNNRRSFFGLKKESNASNTSVSQQPQSPAPPPPQRSEADNQIWEREAERMVLQLPDTVQQLPPQRLFQHHDGSSSSVNESQLNSQALQSGLNFNTGNTLGVPASLPSTKKQSRIAAFFGKDKSRHRGNYSVVSVRPDVSPESNVPSTTSSASGSQGAPSTPPSVAGYQNAPSTSLNVPESQGTLSSSPRSPGLEVLTSPFIALDGSAASKDTTTEIAQNTYSAETADKLREGIDCHENGDLSAAAAIFRELADPHGANHPMAQVLYGLSLRHGWGIPVDEANAFQYLRLAGKNAAMLHKIISTKNAVPASQDTVNSQPNSSTLTGGTTSGTSSSSYAAAVAAARNQAPGVARDELTLATFELANCFRYGWGCNKDPAQALSYYETAANLGDLDAINETAWCYLNGFGTKGKKKDKAKAAQYYRMAEAKGKFEVGNSWIWKDKYNP